MIDWHPKAPLADSLSQILPRPRETLLLRACLRPDAAGRAAWDAWFGAIARAGTQPEQALMGAKGLLPLLYDGLTGNGATVDSRLHSHLRAALLWERRRAPKVHEVLAQAATVFEKAGIDSILLKGAALAGTIYPKPWLRHCHDLDFLLRPTDLIDAGQALHEAGFSNRPAAGRRAGIRMLHSSGLPVELHTGPFANPFYAPPIDAMWTRAGRHDLGGTPVGMLAPPDMLLHLCGHAFCRPNRDLMTWACDAAFLIRRYSGQGLAVSSLDWPIFLESSQSSGLGLPLFVLLSYLARELGETIPDAIIEQLRIQAARSSSELRDAALGELRPGSLRRLFVIAWASGWRSRREIARWALLPTNRFLRRWCLDRRLAWTPFWYLGRPVRSLMATLIRRAA